MNILAVDLGNSRTEFALFHNGMLGKYFFLDTQYLKNHKLPITFPKINVDFCLIASVVPETDTFIKTAIESGFRCKVEFLQYSDNLNIKVDYDSPYLLGADRLAHSFFVKHRVKQNSVVVDIGTAVTIDFIGMDGHFYGGVIFAGPQLQMDSLARFTSKLILSEWKQPTTPISKSPEQAVESGILLSLRSGIFEIVRLGTQTLGWNRFKRFSTGGDANLLKNKSFEFVKHLTLIGIFEAALNHYLSRNHED